MTSWEADRSSMRRMSQGSMLPAQLRQVSSLEKVRIPMGYGAGIWRPELELSASDRRTKPASCSAVGVI